MKSDNFNRMTFSVAITVVITITILIASGISSNIIQLQDARAQGQESMMSMSSNDANMMSMGSDAFRSSLSNSDDKDNFTSSVSIFKPIINAFKPFIQVEITDAITTAQQSVGNNSTALLAYIHHEGQFIVYNVVIVDSNGSFHKVIVDPGNGQIIRSQPVAFIELIKMLEGLHGGGDMMFSGMGMGMMGPPQTGSGGMGMMG